MNNNKTLKLEVKLYDSVGFGYLYGLNQKIAEEDFEKIKPYMRYYRYIDFVDHMKITGIPKGWMCLEKDVSKVEEILNIKDTVESRRKRIIEKFKDPHKKQQIRDQVLDWIVLLYTKGGKQPKQDFSRLVVHGVKIYDPDNSFRDNRAVGKGKLFIYTPHTIWYIINNNSADSDSSLNNISMDEGGAIGYQLLYNPTLDRLIRIYTEENEYNGPNLLKY